MKEIKLIIVNSFIIIFIAVNFSFAVEVKNTSPAIRPVNTAPVAAPKQIKQSPVSPVNAAPAAAPAQIQQPPPPAPTPASDYSYNPIGKPDPFRPFIVVDVPVEKKQSEKKAAAVSSIFPLQMAETEKYRVVGIAGDKDHRIAIAEDVAKKFYPLFIGTHIGIYDGKVIEILADRVIVEEYENKKAKRVILKLRKN